MASISKDGGNLYLKEEEIDEIIDMKESNTAIKAVDIKLLTEKATALAPQMAQMLNPSTPIETKKQIAKPLSTALTGFFTLASSAGTLPPKLAQFADKAMQVGLNLAESELKAIYQKITNKQ